LEEAFHQDISCYGKNDGISKIIATGGTPPYSYNWKGSGGCDCPAWSNLPAGTFSVVVTDANGCTASIEICIKEPPLLSATAMIPSGGNVSCYGGNDGKATVTVSGGTPPYQYLWSNGSSDQTATGLVAGDYHVIVMDANGCSLTTNTVTVTQPGTPLAVMITGKTEPSCEGNINGTATALASGGSGGYTYLWSNGQTGPTAVNLTAGTYIVTVTDVNKCTATATVVLTDPTGVSAMILAWKDVTCYGGNNGEATVTASGGKAPYTYDWTGTPAGDGTSSVTGLTAGMYTVVVTDANGCKAEAVVEIEQPNKMTVSVAVVKNVSCYGGKDGSAQVIPPCCGTPPYAYLWSNGQTGLIATGLGEGTHSVTITDSRGCTASGNVTINQPASAIVIILNTVTNVSCFGGNDGKISVSVTGGTAPYSYNWNNGAPDVEDPGGLIAGNYTLTVTDANGCQLIFGPVTITQPSQALSVTVINVKNADCLGNKTGEATAVASGGTSPYSYFWSNGQTTAKAINLGAGGYTVTVTDARGCISVAGITISDPNNLLVTIRSIVNAACYGSATGSASVDVSGGTPPYTYDWSNDGMEYPDNDASLVSGLAAGIYSVIVTDSKGCTALQTITIAQPAQLIASILFSSDVSCKGGHDGSSTVTVAGGTAPYTYDWSNDGMENPDNDLATVTDLSAGSYTVTVTDANGCQSVVGVIIREPFYELTLSALPTTNYNGFNISCNGKNDGVAYVGVIGGTKPYTYSWSNGSTSAQATGLSADIYYYVTITDARGCTAQTRVILSQPSSLIATAKVDQNASCNGGSNGKATATATGGTPPYQYFWSDGQLTATATNLSAGGYVVTITDKNGCSASAAVKIEDPGGVSLIVTGITNATCYGKNSGSATVLAYGGTSPYTFAWSNGFIQYNVPGASATSVASTLVAGTYTVTVTDSRGCSAIQTVTIGQPPQLTASTVVISNVICHGGSNGSAMVIAAGGTAPYYYLWSNGQSSAFSTGLAAGIHSVTVTDSYNCSTTVNVNITEPTALSVIAGKVADVSCSGEATGSVTVTSATGGTPPYTYSWNTVPVQTTLTATGLSAGTYAVTITDSKGCIATSLPVVISQPSGGSIYLAVPVVTNADCSGNQTGSVKLQVISGGTWPFTYNISTGIFNTTGTFTGLSAGWYTYTVSDANKCTATGSFQITDPNSLVLKVTGIINVACFGTASGSAGVEASGGNSGYSFTWKNSSGIIISSVSSGNSSSATNLPAGTYTIIVTDSRNCQAVQTITVTEPILLVAEIISKTDVSCEGANDGTATVNVTGGKTPYVYSWNTVPVQTAATATGLAAGVYNVIVTDANKCTSTVSVNINKGMTLVLDPLANMGPLCPGSVIPDILLSAKPANAAMSYVWKISGANIGLSGGTATGINPFIPSFTTSLVAGTATVTVTATLNSCSDTKVFTITTGDNINPVLSGVPADVSVECSAVPVVPTTVTASDNCDSQPQIALAETRTNGNCANSYLLTRTWTATDKAGNTVSKSQKITVTDTTPPVITPPGGTLALKCFDAALVTAWTATATATDNCSSAVRVTPTYTPPADNCNKTVTVTFTAVDECGNTATAAKSFSVNDDQPPGLTCPANINIIADQTGTATTNIVNPVATDNCSLSVSVAGVRNDGKALNNPYPLGVTTITWTATDQCGNTATCSQTVTTSNAIVCFSIKALLQGAMLDNGGTTLMRDNLRVSPFTGANYIPVKDPYSTTAYNTKFVRVLDGLNSALQAVTDSTAMFGNHNSTSDDIVDWMFVELRDKANNTSVISTRSVLVQRDGDFVDVDGSPCIRFPATPADDYYVVVRHRNHLGVMSAIPISKAVLSGGGWVDFTNGSTQEWNFGANHPTATGIDFSGLSQVTVNGKRAMWYGNSRSDRQIKYQAPNDDPYQVFRDVILHPNNTSRQYNFDFGYGYFDADVNMNSKVKYQAPGDDVYLIFRQVMLYPLNASTPKQYNFDFLLQQIPY
jgi:large repetitive protein